MPEATIHWLPMLAALAGAGAVGGLLAGLLGVGGGIVIVGDTDEHDQANRPQQRGQLGDDYDEEDRYGAVIRDKKAGARAAGFSAGGGSGNRSVATPAVS
mgnify:CR=1 FL=1